MDDIRLGRPGREEQLDLFCEQLRAMGAVGVPVLCYNWVAVYSWARTGLAVPARGGALVTEYDHAEMMKAPPRPEADAATEERPLGELRVLPPARRSGCGGGERPARAAPGRPSDLARPRPRPDHAERRGVRARRRARAERPQRDHDVPGELRAHDRRPAGRDPGASEVAGRSTSSTSATSAGRRSTSSRPSTTRGRPTCSPA